MRDGRVHFLGDTVYLQCGAPSVRTMSASLAATPCPTSTTPLSPAGCSLAPDRRGASRLPANYPLGMFVAKCHGTEIGNNYYVYTARCPEVYRRIPPSIRPYTRNGWAGIRPCT